MVYSSMLTWDEITGYLAWAKLGIPSDFDHTTFLIDVKVHVFELLEHSSLVDVDVVSFTELKDRWEKGYIWVSALNFSFEGLARHGLVEQSSGDVQTAKIGDMQTTFQRWQPMFFFAQGMAEGFYELLPHETYRMRGNRYIRAWRRWMFRVKRNDEVAFGTAYANLDPQDNKYDYGMGSPIDF